MNKYLKISLLSLFVIGCCTGCNGSITREIRHGGFAISGKFVCSALYPKDKEDTSYERIRYYTGTHIITKSGKIYEISPGQAYANNENCKEADTAIKEQANLDFKIIKAEDNKYYSLFGENGVNPYTEISTENKDYQLYDLLLKDPDVVKVLTIDSNNGVYYSLKNDGNVYKIVLGKADYNSPFTITGVEVAYDKNDFGGAKIIDFSYTGDQSLYTFIRTEERLYRMRIQNVEECSKYADIQCKYKMEQDPIFDTYKDNIIGFNGNVLLTNYKQTFTVAK